MRRTPSQTKSASKKPEDSFSLRKPKKTTSFSQTSGLSSRFTSHNTEPNIRTGGNYNSAAKIGSFKDTPSISDLSLEASLSLRDLKNFDNENRFLSPSKNLSAFDEHFNDTFEETGATTKDIAVLKRNLNEAQKRAILATKELSKIQYEKTLLENQLKKSEVTRFKLSRQRLDTI